MISRTRRWQIVAVVVSAAGLSLACGVGPRQSAAPPGYVPPPVVLAPSTHSVVLEAVVGEVSKESFVTVTNESDRAVHVKDVVLRGVGMSDFRVANNCGSVLQVHGYCGVRVTFVPTKPGESHAGVFVDVDGPGSTVIAVSGFGTAKVEK